MTDSTNFDINFRVTEAGLQAALSEEGKGLQLPLTHISIGTEGYAVEPRSDATALRDEKEKAEIAAHDKDAENKQLNMSAIFRHPEDITIREVGIWSGDTLVYLWSDEDQALGYKDGGFALAMGFSQVITDLPIDAITVVDQGVNAQVWIKPITDDLKGEHAPGEKYHYELHRQLETALFVAGNSGQLLRQFIDSQGQDGLVNVRDHGPKGPNISLFDSSGTSFGAGGDHNHPDNKWTLGVPEQQWFQDGDTFFTRHLDPDVKTPKIGGDWLAVDRIEAPAVPEAISSAGSIAEQVAEAKEWVVAMATNNPGHRDYRGHSIVIMLGMESWREQFAEELAERGDSHRHVLDENSLHTLDLQNKAYANTGHRPRFENKEATAAHLAYVDAIGKPVFAHRRYRMISTVLGDENQYPIEDIVHPNVDLQVLLKYGNTVDGYLDSTRARFKINHERGNPHFGNVYGPGLLHEFAQKLPGLNNGEALVAEYLDTGRQYELKDPTTGETLNVGNYYHWARIEADAVGRSDYRNGWRNANKLTALTTRPEVVGFTDPSSGFTYQYSSFSPYTLLRLSWLNAWNPHGIQWQEKAEITGSGTQEDPYSGWNESSYYHLTPAELYDELPSVDPADTGVGAVWVRDANGSAVRCARSGVHVQMPAVNGHKLRMRYPVWEAYNEGSPAYQQIQALSAMVLDTQAALAEMKLNAL